MSVLIDKPIHYNTRIKYVLLYCTMYISSVESRNALQTMILRQINKQC